MTALPTHQANIGGPPWWETDPTVAVLADIHGCAARVDAEVPAGALVLRECGRVDYASFDEGLALEHGTSDRTVAWCER